MNTIELEYDIVVIGGGTGGPMAAVKAKETQPDAARAAARQGQRQAQRRDLAWAWTGSNNAVIPGHATPEQYVKEITIANDGIVNQKARAGLRRATASR